MKVKTSTSLSLLRWMMAMCLMYVSMAAFAQPANDLCADVIVVEAMSSTSGTTTGATTTGDPTAFCGLLPLLLVSGIW